MSLCERDDVKTAEGPKVNGGRVPACTALGDFSGGELTMSTEARPTLSAVWTQSTSLAQQKLVDTFAAKTFFSKNGFAARFFSVQFR